MTLPRSFAPFLCFRRAGCPYVELWFTDNGRDWAGDEGPQEELNRVSAPGQNFGFPYCHAQGIVDPEIKKPNACDGVTMPVTLMGQHEDYLTATMIAYRDSKRSGTDTTMTGVLYGISNEETKALAHYFAQQK